MALACSTSHALEDPSLVPWRWSRTERLQPEMLVDDQRTVWYKRLAIRREGEHAMRSSIVATVALLSVLSIPVAAQDDKLVIVIDTFENPANDQSSTIGNALTDMFITSLSRTGAFTVMDGRGGGDIEADLYLGAKVTNFSYQEERVSETDRSFFRRSNRETTFQQTMNVRIDITAVDDGQEILFAEAVEHNETNTSAAEMETDYRRLLASSVSVREMTGSMMGRATEGAIERAVERLTTYFDILGPSAKPVEANVVGLVDTRMAVIDKGRAAGVRAGDELALLRNEPITNASGQVVFHASDAHRHRHGDRGSGRGCDHQRRAGGWRSRRRYCGARGSRPVRVRSHETGRRVLRRRLFLGGSPRIPRRPGTGCGGGRPLPPRIGRT